MLYIAESAQLYSAFSPTTISLTPRFRRKREVWLRVFAENAQNDPETTIAKSALNSNPCFRRQRSAMLRAFGENGEWSKTLNIWANFKNMFENVGCTAFCIAFLWWPLERRPPLALSPRRPSRVGSPTPWPCSPSGSCSSSGSQTPLSSPGTPGTCSWRSSLSYGESRDMEPVHLKITVSPD